MTRRQVPKRGWHRRSRLNRAEVDALERIAAVLERLEAHLVSEPGGGSGGPPDTAPRRRRATPQTPG